MFKKLTKSILMVMLLICSFSLVACGDKGKNNNGDSNGSLEGKAIEKVELLTDIKNTYFVGETLDIDEAKIKVTYKNKNTEEIVIVAEMVSGFDTSTAGEKTLVITYEKKTIEVPYTVVSIVPTTMVLKSNFKTAYYVGDSLSLDDGIVTLTYNNETTKDVELTSQHISNFSTAEAGTFNLTITVEGKTLEVPYTVTAVELVSISIKTPFKTTYFVGDTLSVENAKLTLTYSSGRTEDIDINKDMISGFTSAAPATINLTLTYGGKTISNISCQIRAVELVGVALKAPFADTEYFVGETINLDGNKLLLTYNNGEKEIDVTDEMISNFDTTSAGTDKQFTINHLGHTIPVNYTVTEVVATSLELVSGFTNTNYYIGDRIDHLTDGDIVIDAMIKVAYNYGPENTIPVTIDMIRDFSTTTATTDEEPRKFIIEYKSSTLKIEYTVTEVVVTGIELTKPFNKTTYYLGQTIDVSGAEITVTYNNGKPETIAVEESMIKSLSTGVEGENKKFKVTYKGFTIQVPYVVKERYVNIQTPIKLTYSAGEELSVDGGKLIVTYTDGTPAEYIDITAEMISGFSTTTTGSRELSIYYDGITIKQTYIVE